MIQILYGAKVSVGDLDVRRASTRRRRSSCVSPAVPAQELNEVASAARVGVGHVVKAAMHELNVVASAARAGMGHVVKASSLPELQGFLLAPRRSGVRF